MDVREKLVEIMEDLGCNDEYCKDCEFCNDIDGCVHRRKEIIADRLIANGVTVQEWIPVKDRLPEEKVNCIVHYKHAYCDNDDYWAIGICFYDGEKFQMGLSYKVTHWQYLPQPPKGE